MTQREKELTQQVERLTNMVNALVQELAEAKAEIAELKEQLNKNSQNSSNPPSQRMVIKSPRPKASANHPERSRAVKLDTKEATSRSISPLPISSRICLLLAPDALLTRNVLAGRVSRRQDAL